MYKVIKISGNTESVIIRTSCPTQALEYVETYTMYDTRNRFQYKVQKAS